MKMIKVVLLLMFFVFTSTQIYSQETNPVVDNVSFTYDGSNITVTYDISDAEQTSVNVRVFISEDSGVSWDDSTNAATSGTGSVTVSSSASSKTIVLPYSGSATSLMVKVLADDETAGGSPCSGIEKVYYEGGPNSDAGGAYYTTIQIGDQCWLKENLDVGTMINSSTGGTNGDGAQTDNSTIEKYCYNNDANNCTTYGGLYQWDEAMQYVSTEGAQGICPSGWHIPSKSEFETLISYVNSQSVKFVDENETMSGYTPTNTSGFSALFGGLWQDYNTSFTGFEIYENFWTSTLYISGRPYLESVYYGSNFFSEGIGYNPDGYSIRCLKD